MEHQTKHHGDGVETQLLPHRRRIAHLQDFTSDQEHDTKREVPGRTSTLSVKSAGVAGREHKNHQLPYYNGHDSEHGLVEALAEVDQGAAVGPHPPQHDPCNYTSIWSNERSLAEVTPTTCGPNRMQTEAG